MLGTHTQTDAQTSTSLFLSLFLRLTCRQSSVHCALSPSCALSPCLLPRYSLHPTHPTHPLHIPPPPSPTPCSADRAQRCDAPGPRLVPEHFAEQTIQGEWIPTRGQWPADPQDDVAVSPHRVWVDGCFDFTHHGEPLAATWRVSSTAHTRHRRPCWCHAPSPPAGQRAAGWRALGRGYS